MSKVHNRAKRLDNRKKAEIITKEQQCAENIVKLKESQNTLVNMRF